MVGSSENSHARIASIRHEMQGQENRKAGELET